MEGLAPKTPEKNFSNKEALKISFGFFSVASEMHPGVNEDAILVDDEEKTFGVFDGLGGRAAGDVASRTACGFILNRIEKLIPSGISVEQAENILLNLARQTKEALIEKEHSDPKYEGMGTTLSLVKIHKNENGELFAIVLNIGDSRTYKFNKKQEEGKELEQVSFDDDELSEKKNILPEEKKVIREHLAQAKTPDDLNYFEQDLFNSRHKVAQELLGSTHCFSSVIKINAGDKFVIISDGIHDNLTFEEIKNVLAESGSDEDLAKRLVQEATKRSNEKIMRSKYDDMTAVVISFNE
ncbi:MAG: PP2C family serine/threonine-protein phosphatase [Candidatus Paceibacterota bacterium]|jgi:protein phosphatase